MCWYSISTLKVWKRHFKQASSSEKSSFLVFDNAHYNQIDGVTIAFPSELSFINLFWYTKKLYTMKPYTMKLLCPLPFKPKYYRWDVNDMLLILQESMLTLISITRVANELHTTSFQKKTFGGLYINCNRYLPPKYKQDLLHTSLYWTYCIISPQIILTYTMKLFS